MVVAVVGVVSLVVGGGGGGGIGFRSGDDNKRVPVMNVMGGRRGGMLRVHRV